MCKLLAVTCECLVRVTCSIRIILLGPLWVALREAVCIRRQPRISLLTSAPLNKDVCFANGIVFKWHLLVYGHQETQHIGTCWSTAIRKHDILAPVGLRPSGNTIHWHLLVYDHQETRHIGDEDRIRSSVPGGWGGGGGVGGYCHTKAMGCATEREKIQEI